MPGSSGADVSDSEPESGEGGDEQGEPVPESPKLDDAEVAAERAASLDRTKLANSQFEIMSAAWANMQLKVATNEDRRPQVRTPVIVPAGPATRGERAAEATKERFRHGQLVAEELAKREVKAHSFAARRQAVLANHETRKAEVASALEIEDAKRVERQQVMQIEQKRKTFIKQQQRSEQQKALKELQREQQRIYDDYYKKHHNALAAAKAEKSARSPDTSVFQSSEASVSSLRGSKSLSSLADTSMSMMAGTSTTSLADDGSEDFYMETLRNHALYAEKLEGAAQLVHENERRTEAHWRKMLIRTGGRRDDPHLVDRARGKLLQRTPKDAGHIESFSSRTRTKTCGSDSHSGGETRLPDLQSIRRGGSTPPGSPGSPARSRRHMLMPCYRRRSGALHECFSDSEMSNSQWKPSQADEMEYASRIGAWEGKVADRRNRMKSFNEDKAGKARSMTSLWELRDREAKLKRAKAERASNDPTLLNKTMENVNRAAANREELFNERVEKFGSKWETMENVRHNAASLAKQTEKEKWLKQMNAEDIVTSNVKKKLGEWQVSAGSSEQAEMAARKLEIKEQLDRETRRNASNEIEGKDNKLQRSMRRMKTSTLEKEKQNKKSLGKLMRTPQACAVDDLLEPLPEALPQGQGEMTIGPRPKVRRERRQDTGASGVQHHSDSDSSGEHEFLDELNGQCSQWLQETRKQNEVQ